MFEQFNIEPFIVYTDGSCVPSIDPTVNKNFGGWAYYATRFGEVVAHDNGIVEENPTNQRAELIAALEAVRGVRPLRVHTNIQVFVRSDSAYLVNCYQQHWIFNWIKNGWLTSNRTPVKNKDLWEQLYPYMSSKYYIFEKVAGHANDYYNCLCDKEANKRATNLRSGFRDYQPDLRG